MGIRRRSSRVKIDGSLLVDVVRKSMVVMFCMMRMLRLICFWREFILLCFLSIFMVKMVFEKLSVKVSVSEVDRFRLVKSESLLIMVSWVIVVNLMMIVVMCSLEIV